MGIKKISRKTIGGFNLVSCHPVNGHLSEDFCKSLKSKNLAGPKDAYVCYELPVTRDPKLIMMYVLHFVFPINTHYRNCLLLPSNVTNNPPSSL